eukprot:6490623-Amphidinium_carterae.1
MCDSVCSPFAVGRVVVDMNPHAEEPREVALLKAFGKPSTPHTAQDVSSIYRLAETLKVHLCEEVNKIARSAGGQPFMLWYSCDATPAKVPVSVFAHGHGVFQQGVHRSGKAGMEFLLEVLFASTITCTGSIQSAVYLREPRPLSKGKTALHHLACYEQCVRGIQIPREGIVIEVFCSDRMLFSSLSELIWQHCELKLSEKKASALEHLLHWNLAIPCSMHDGQNALKWAVAGQCQSSSLVADLYIVIESLRNSFDLLHLKLPEHIRTHLEFTQERCDESVLYQFWMALGAGGEVLNMLVNMQLRFVQNKLLVYEGWQEHDDVGETVAYCILYLCRFRAFTESRWLSLCATCQTLLGALAVGLEALVALVRNSAHCSDYYLHGFSKLTPELKDMLVITVFPGYVVNGYMSQLMEDDRLLVDTARISTAMEEELNWMMALTREVWSTFVVAIGGEEQKIDDLRSRAIHASHTAQAFITERVIARLREPPWNVFAADPAHVFSVLGAMEEVPSERVTEKIWRLHRAGIENENDPYLDPHFFKYP